MEKSFANYSTATQHRKILISLNILMDYIFLILFLIKHDFVVNLRKLPSDTPCQYNFL